MSAYHESVMSAEVVAFLTREGTRGGRMVDATVGGGGHAEALLRSRPDISVIGLDRDEDAVRQAGERLKPFGERARIVKANFCGLDEVMAGGMAAGVVMDLGVSSHQFDEAGRGFSFQRDGPLDMRMDRGAGPTAAEVVNARREEELADIFWKWGGEGRSRRIAKAVVEARKRSAIRTTGELAEIVARAVGGRGKIHPATRVFQALRIVVNDEMGALEEGLGKAWGVLEEGGRLVVISFHSLEDRLVKMRFREWGGGEGTGVILTKKPRETGKEEQRRNPRSRSAKLRAIGKNKI